MAGNAADNIKRKKKLKGDCEINTEQTSNGKCRKNLRVMWSGRIGT